MELENVLVKHVLTAADLPDSGDMGDSGEWVSGVTWVTEVNG